MEVSVVGKVNHTLHKLGAATVVFRPIVAIAHQRREVSKGLAHRVPPLGDAVSQAGAGDFGADSVEQDCIVGRHQATHWGQGRLGLAIVIGGRDLGSTFAPTRQRANCDGGFGIERHASGIGGGIGSVMDLMQACEEGVGVRDFFCGRLLATCLGK